VQIKGSKYTIFDTHQRAWHEILIAYLLDHDFTRGETYHTLLIRRSGNNLLIAYIYVDVIVFGATIDSHAHSFLPY